MKFIFDKVSSRLQFRFFLIEIRSVIAEITMRADRGFCFRFLHLISKDTSKHLGWLFYLPILP
jgi:hypothetical protein